MNMDYAYGDDWSAAPDLRTALVIGHPGHELLVHEWVEVTHPFVFVLTDGSGRSNQSRLASTTKILNQTGAKCGSIYGRLTDAAAYAAILNHEFELFIGLAKELSEALVTEQVDCVAGDAFEGYNPVHDVCRLVINAAVTVALRARGKHIACFEFSSEPGGPRPLPARAIQRRLDDSAFARKIVAARGYAELEGEVLTALRQTPGDQLRVECLCPVDSGTAVYRCDEPPFYEKYGERQVAAGYYDQVLRYREHIAPLANALKRYANTDAA